MDLYFDEDMLPTGTKQPRPTGSSATSRKNKLQRCSVCGGLGHKSRTCELAATKMGAGAQALSSLIGSDDGESKDPRTVLAAYGLLTLAEATQPLQPMFVNQEFEFPRPDTPPASPWQLPSSPRIMAA